MPRPILAGSGGGPLPEGDAVPQCYGCGGTLPHAGECPTVRGRGPAVPGPVTAARVLVALGGVGDVLWGVVAVVSGIVAFSVRGAVGTGDLGSSELEPLGVTTFSDLAGLLVVLGVLLLVIAVVEFRCAARFGRADRRARAVYTGLVVANLVLCVVAGMALDTSFLVTLVVATPGAALVLGLLWLTASARRFFGDEPLPKDAPPRTPRPAPSPYDLPTPAIGLPLTPADVVVPARVARFCSRCGQPNTPGGAFCGQCGASLRHAVARR
jgi:hypothetical protein